MKSRIGKPNTDTDTARHKRLAADCRVSIMPADDRRQERLEEGRRWLADQDGDEGWLEEEDEETLRLLVLVHRMTATRLGLPNLYSALNDRSPEDLGSGLIDGTAWVVRPLLSYILPVVLARYEGREFEILRLLRKHSPRLQPDALAGLDTARLLNGLQGQIGELVEMLEPGSGARVGDIVRFMRGNNLMAFDDRYVEIIDLYAGTTEPVADPPANRPVRWRCNWTRCHLRGSWLNAKPFISRAEPALSANEILQRTRRFLATVLGPVTV
ncbi:MAG: hypothetical protein AAF479_04455 [Pseudomonadota bacterium]